MSTEPSHKKHKSEQYPLLAQKQKKPLDYTKVVRILRPIYACVLFVVDAKKVRLALT